MNYIETGVPLRDPFVLVYENRYYLYGTRVETCWGFADGFDVWESDDLLHWSGKTEVFHNDGSFWADKNYWAPEVHVYKKEFYMFASFKKEGKARGTQILKAVSPKGPFVPITDKPITPSEWECLDGTLFIDEHQKPYIVFCHEWKQIGNGTICAMELSEDLKEAVSSPIVLFDAKGAGWTTNIMENESYVTDGPFLWRMMDGSLCMLWSSHGEKGYVQAIAKSKNGSIEGPWDQRGGILFEKDGGHGMIFRCLGGNLMLALHTPNDTPNEKVVFLPIEEMDNTFTLSK